MSCNKAKSRQQRKNKTKGMKCTCHSIKRHKHMKKPLHSFDSLVKYLYGRSLWK